MNLWPFFSFYGGKWRSAPHYPKPLNDTIIEPFAGSAGYSVRNYQSQIILVEKDPTIAALWRYLIAAKEADILALPLLTSEESVDDFSICQEAKTLIGFWLNKGAASACKTPSAWMRSNIRPKSYWGKEIRERISKQVCAISHWTILEGDYSTAPLVEGTWFIDPPYQKAGKLYRFSSSSIDFQQLAVWCLERKNQVIVCENEGADWLPFVPFKDFKSTPGSRGKSKTKEVIFTSAGFFLPVQSEFDFPAKAA